MKQLADSMTREQITHNEAILSRDVLADLANRLERSAWFAHSNALVECFMRDVNELLDLRFDAPDLHHERSITVNTANEQSHI